MLCLISMYQMQHVHNHARNGPDIEARWTSIHPWFCCCHGWTSRYWESHGLACNCERHIWGSSCKLQDIDRGQTPFTSLTDDKKGEENIDNFTDTSKLMFLRGLDLKDRCLLTWQSFFFNGCCLNHVAYKMYSRRWYSFTRSRHKQEKFTSPIKGYVWKLHSSVLYLFPLIVLWLWGFF